MISVKNTRRAKHKQTNKNWSTTENGLANASLSDEDKDISDVSAETISKPYDRTKEKLPKGAAFTGATLSLKSETTLSLYFTGLPADTTFTCTGNKTVETVTTDSYTIARIRGIRADELATDFTVTFKGGSVTYNPMCYCYNVLNGGSDDTSLKNTVKALYKYYAEAARYYPVSWIGGKVWKRSIILLLKWRLSGLRQRTSSQQALKMTNCL